jgi:hypothetical protein
MCLFSLAIVALLGYKYFITFRIIYAIGDIIAMLVFIFFLLTTRRLISVKILDSSIIIRNLRGQIELTIDDLQSVDKLYHGHTVFTFIKSGVELQVLPDMYKNGSNMLTDLTRIFISDETEKLEDAGMDSNTYKVRIVRPVFQSVIVEVEADNEEEAVSTALGQADTIAEEGWIGTFDSEKYFYDAQCLEEDFDEDHLEVDEDAEHFIDPDEYVRYLLLKANIYSGDGEVLYQPWLEEEDVDDQMLADLCEDWSGQLEGMQKGDVDDAIEIMEEQIHTPSKQPAKVYQFKRPSDPDKIK